VHVTDRTVDAHVCRLRRKLSGAGCTHNVEPVYGVGYRFARPTEEQ
jgi:DNA-binding response OmpR family regulator